MTHKKTPPGRGGSVFLTDLRYETGDLRMPALEPVVHFDFFEKDLKRVL